MRYFSFLLLFLCLLCAGAYFYALNVYIPQQIEQRVAASFSSLGFEDVKYETIDHGNGKIVFHSISLNKESFSGIESVSVEYSPLGFFLNNGNAEIITIKGLQLTGEITNDLKLTIAGWKNDGSMLRTLKGFPANLLVIDKGVINLLTESFDGIKVDCDLQIRQADKKSEILGHIVSKQKKLSFDSKITGKLNEKNNLEIVADAEDVQLDIQDLKINRAAAQINIMAFTYSAPDITIQAQAGSINWKKLPLLDANIVVERKDQNLNVYSEGRTLGDEAIEFTASMGYENDVETLEATFHPKHISDLVAYLKRNHLIGEEDSFPAFILNIENPEIVLETSASSIPGISRGKISFQPENQKFFVEGDYEYNATKNVLEGTFYMPPTSLNQQVPSEDDPNLEALSTDTAALENAETISVSGMFRKDFNDITKKSRWALNFEFGPLAIAYGPIKLQNIKGKFSYTDDDMGKKQTPRPSILDFSLPLNDNIPQSGKVVVNMDNSNEELIREITLKIYGGEVRTSSFNLQKGNLPQKLMLQVSDIDLGRFFSDAKLGKFKVSGKMGGVLPVEVVDGVLKISGGILQSQQGGSVSIPETISKGLFPGNEKQMVTIRKALKNYRYEFFEIRLDGIVSEALMMTLKAKGYNPDYMNQRPVELNLQIETPVSFLFDNIIKK